MAVLRDGVARVPGVVHEDFLRGDENPRCGAEALDVYGAVFLLEFAEVETREVARGVVEEHVLRARIAGVDRRGGLARVPALDGVLILETGIAADVCALGNRHQHVSRLHGLDGLAVRNGAKLIPGFVLGGLHESVVHAHGLVHILERHTAVGRTVE